MVDLERKVCCMCGDVGFFDKLFHCSKCLNRFQHSYVFTYLYIYTICILMCFIFIIIKQIHIIKLSVAVDGEIACHVHSLYLFSSWSSYIKSQACIYVYLEIGVYIGCVFCQTKQENCFHNYHTYMDIIIINSSSWWWSQFWYRYCSSYYKEQADPIKICDWCQCEARNRTGAKHGVNGGSSKRSYRSEYSSAHQVKQQEINQITATSSSIPPAADKGKTGVPSPRPATRRYKLLKDVMC